MNPVGDWRPIFDVLMDGSADAADYIAAQIIPKDRYFRWQTRLEKGMDEMDDASRTNIDALVDRAVYHLSAEGGHDNMVRIKPLLNPA